MVRDRNTALGGSVGLLSAGSADFPVRPAPPVSRRVGLIARAAEGDSHDSRVKTWGYRCPPHLIAREVPSLTLAILPANLRLR